MTNFKTPTYFLLIILCLISSLRSLCILARTVDRKTYIVYMGAKSEKYSLSAVEHLDILQQVSTNSIPNELLIRSYGRSFNGFSANLTPNEVQNLRSIKGVVSVFPSRTLELQTTRSWDFLGFPEPTLQQQQGESDVIVGVIDTGIWPELPSFNDQGFGPIPSKWKGACDAAKNVTCNKKLIGAMSYSEPQSRDYDGHGSHCASIAAGSKVENTSFYGIASGTARGGAPFARIAMYKVCGTITCNEGDILAAFDDAIADGVDVVSISIGGYPQSIYRDGIAIGAFHAAQKGILTVQSGGNSGDEYGSVGSVAPWILSVAASTTDRRIVTKLVLDNGPTLTGTSVNAFTMKKEKYPLVDAAIAEGLTGKIVVTEDADGKEELLLQGGAAGVVTLSFIDDTSFIVPGPVVFLPKRDFNVLKTYLRNNQGTEGRILKSETVKDTTAPVVASFSSRGPNTIAPDILKPDITAPGVDILAGYSPLAPLTKASSDKRRVEYSILSGTSMAAPHVAGAATYLKSLHPDWSPSAIKSALMTTSQAMSPLKNKEGEFAYGSGHLNPVAASNPGLVYETTEDDYVSFLCKLHYSKDQLKKILGNETVSCPRPSAQQKLAPNDVNYPSLLIKLNISNSFTPINVDFRRTVTNVGNAKSTYTSKVVSSERNIKVTVVPSSLSFKSVKEQQSFSVKVVAQGLSHGVLYSASLVWSDGIHSVRSPILLYS